MLRAGILAAVFVCAACGLVYELALVALGSYLLGSSITQASLVISVTLCAMGAGAVVAKPLVRRPAAAFVSVELSLAVVGGFSVPALYASFAWLAVYTPAMLVCATAIGLLIGAEIPLLMELMQRLRAQRASSAVADITAVDYAGALVGGLAFPFLLLPVFGLLEGTLVVAALNVLAAWAVGGAIARRSGSGRGLAVTSIACLAVVVLLVGMATLATRFEATARQALFRDPIVHAERSKYQEIVLTQGALFGAQSVDFRMFLDGDLQFSSVDEYRYHEALVHPAMRGPHDRVLILGGGDGLALREVLRYADVQQVTLVDLDPAVVELARENSRLRRLNDRAFADPRVDYVAADAFAWARRQGGAYDVIIADFPDPDSTATAKLYSRELYAVLERLLADRGRLVVQAGSPFFAPDSFWCVDATVAAAGLQTVPYHVDVPSFGDWGFVLAAASEPVLRLPEDAPPGLRFLTDAVLEAAATFPPDRDDRPVEVSTLLKPVIVEYQRSGWVGY
ncbi:MAG TPA: polyamine aminopropyltransferase [Nocardioidaceae bacterium]|nr:polyamine aminopropyltransferase [Nocardioidaceae bacterium]